LANDEPEGEMKDGAKVASSLYEKFGNEVEQTIKSSDYAQRLKEVVSDEDLSYCCQRDGMQVLPVMNEGIISDFYGKKKINQEAFWESSQGPGSWRLLVF